MGLNVPMTYFARALTTALLALGVGFGLNVTAANAAKDVTLTVTELPAQVRLVPGESIELVQETNRTTGYTWKARVRGDQGAITVGPGKYTAPNTDLVGAPGITTWRITADRPGRAVVRVVATPPGGGSPTVTKLTVIVMDS